MQPRLEQADDDGQTRDGTEEGDEVSALEGRQLLDRRAMAFLVGSVHVIVAMRPLAAIGDISRFDSPEKLASYLNQKASDDAGDHSRSPFRLSMLDIFSNAREIADNGNLASHVA